METSWTFWNGNKGWVFAREKEDMSEPPLKDQYIIEMSSLFHASLTSKHHHSDEPQSRYFNLSTKSSYEHSHSRILEEINALCEYYTS